MASQAAIAEGSTVVIADQLDYVQKHFAHPTYKYNPQFSNTSGQPINLGQSSMTPVTINIPPEVFNMGQAFLNYTVTLPGVQDRYIWLHEQMFREISQIQYYAGSSMYIVDIPNLQNYADIVIKAEVPEDEWYSMDTVLDGAGLSNSVVNVVPALRNSNNLVINNPNGLGINPSSVNYREPGYFRVGGLGGVDGVGGTVTYKVQLDLHKLRNTFFAIDKDFYFGSITYFKVSFGPLSKICYLSDSNNHPSAGTKTSYVRGSLAGPLGIPRITDFQLMLPIETNIDIVTMVKTKFQTSGLTFDIPFVQSWKNSNQGNAQTINIEFQPGMGRYLEKVYHTLYNITEDYDLSYDRANNQTIAGVTDPVINQKTYQYWTAINGQRQEDLTIDCTFDGGYLDYMMHRRNFKSSILSNRDVFQYNWYHCSDYANFSLNKKIDQVNDGTLISGLPLTSSLTWSFVGYKMRNGVNNSNFNHYTFAVFVKRLIISPGIVMVE